MRPVPRLGPLALAAVLAAAVCTGLAWTDSPAPAPQAEAPAAATAPPDPTSSSAPAPVDTPGCVDRLATSLDAHAEAGQLLVVAASLTAPRSSATTLVGDVGPGGVMLTGRSRGGVTAIAALTSAMQDAARKRTGIGVLVAVDQEGGLVQTLTGPGFATMPPATVQGGMASGELRTAALGWGRQLAAAGIDLDLAPVSDVLDPGLGRANLSVGVNNRTYGTTPPPVTAGVLAFAGGLRDAGVAATVKHFPGLGAVGPNTDDSTNVRDTVTSPQSATLDPFRSAVQAGVPVVMISSATYSRIDAVNRAAFSSTVIDDLLRGQLGFGGVVISDDLGNAKAVADLPAGERAVRFVAAGGDLVLSVDPATARPMQAALTERIGADPAFAAKAEAAVHRVLTLKAALGLLRC